MLSFFVQASEKSLKKHEEDWSSMEQKCTRMIANTKEMEKKFVHFLFCFIL